MRVHDYTDAIPNLVGENFFRLEAEVEDDSEDDQIARAVDLDELKEGQAGCQKQRCKKKNRHLKLHLRIIWYKPHLQSNTM